MPYRGTNSHWHTGDTRHRSDLCNLKPDTEGLATRLVGVDVLKVEPYDSGDLFRKKDMCCMAPESTVEVTDGLLFDSNIPPQYRGLASLCSFSPFMTSVILIHHFNPFST